jgi:hypothetical protein
MDALDDRIREANIPYVERPQYREKLLRRLDGLSETRENTTTQFQEKKHHLNKEEGKMAMPIWQGTEGLWHDVEAQKFRPLTDQGRQRLHKLDGLLKTGGNKATQGLELLTFSGNKKTKEDSSGIKHIGATDLLKEMTRRRIANSDWENAATIAHCARSFRNDVAVWWQEVVPSDNSPKQLKKINTSWEQFKRIFRQAWIIETTLPPQAWLDNNQQKQEENLVDYITRVQEASLPATMAERAIKGAPNHKGEEGEPPGNDHVNGGIATFDKKRVAPQKPQETIAAYVTRVQMAVATTSGEAIAYTRNVKQDSNTPRWNNRASAKCITAQAVFDKRAVERPWMDRELTKIAARNDEYGHEQQQAARYECRRIMTTVVTCEIVKNGLSNPIMRKVATKIAEECTQQMVSRRN